VAHQLNIGAAQAARYAGRSVSAATAAAVSRGWTRLRQLISDLVIAAFARWTAATAGLSSNVGARASPPIPAGHGRHPNLETHP
jgi:hypothetical protein